MANDFKNITYSRQLYESLRHYLSVNTDQEISELFQILLCFLQVLQAPFDAYNVFRVKEALIAQCKFQVGQLTNVLNYLYDGLLNRITITQNSINAIVDPQFEYAAIHYDSDFDSDPEMFERTFGDKVGASIVSINVPDGVDLADLIATVEQIKMKGIPYKITII